MDNIRSCVVHAEKSDKSVRTSDIVTLFIGMYGSKEKFIKEYQVKNKLMNYLIQDTHKFWYVRKIVQALFEFF